MTKDHAHGMLSLPTKDGLELLKPAREQFAKGFLRSRVDVCRFLLKKGFWKGSNPDKYISRISAVMKDPFYAGYIEYPKRGVERRLGKHEGIISIETFELIQKRLRKEDSGIRVRLDVRDDFPLRGLLLCNECGSHLTSGWSKGRNKKHPYYLCQKKDCSFYRKSLKKKDVEDRFKILLKKCVLKKEVDALLKVVFDGVWQDEVGKLKKEEAERNTKKKSIEEDIGKLAISSSKTGVEAAKRAYEDQIEILSTELENLGSGSVGEIDLTIPYRTALDKVSTLLKSPYKIWTSLDAREKQETFFFIFNEKLHYDKNTGYRTDKIPAAVRLFEDFVASNSMDVEMGGIEPPCRRV